MALSDLDAYLTRLKNPILSPWFKKASDGLGSRPVDGWLSSAGGLFGGAAPSTAVVPTNATTGAIGQADGSAAGMRLIAALLQGDGPCTWMLCDRLSHQGGLSGSSSTTQTTNLPTAALTRYTSGDGVMACLSVYASIGGTPKDLTVSYTNQAGVSGQVSIAQTIGGNPQLNAGSFTPIPLVATDTGIRSIESAILSGTTGTTGNFGLTLYKPLAMMMTPAIFATSSGVQDAAQAMHTWFDGLIGGPTAVILPGACLFWVKWGWASMTAGVRGHLLFAED